MEENISELVGILEELKFALAKVDESTVAIALDKLYARTEKIDRASCKYWRNGHANVYYEGFEQPPSDHTYIKPFTLPGTYMVSDNPKWKRYSSCEVVKLIQEDIDQTIVEKTTEIANENEKLFEDKRTDVASLLEISNKQRFSDLLQELLKQTWDLELMSVTEIINRKKPRRDPEVLLSAPHVRGNQTPPHIEILANVGWIRNTTEQVRKLSKIVEKTIAHMKRANEAVSSVQRTGNRIFIGHGKSRVWLELEKFLKERLNQEVEEFNRVPFAGITTVDRLEKMLENATFAFLVLTAEDETADSTMQPRMNVIHEAGLFQGRLGFDKAIILLEEECEQFSNIEGLGQIRFPKNNIGAKFEEIRQLLEDRNIIPH